MRGVKEGWIERGIERGRWVDKERGRWVDRDEMDI